MDHLCEHPHAFVTNGIVTNIAIFAGHDADLLDAVQNAGGHDGRVCLCDHGSVTAIGVAHDGTGFVEPPEPPPAVQTD